MSKPAFIEINIPHPCNQSWDEMTANGKGRFCDHCQKTVIDFTAWSDAALYKFFSKNTGHVCGRFLSTQVDRKITIPHQPHSQLYRITIALGLTLLFTQTPQLLAQNRPPKTTQTSNTYNNQKEDTTTTQTAGEIRGRVLDEKKEPIINAVIQVYINGVLKGSNITDYDGNYSIKPLEIGYYEITVTYSGYDSLFERSVIVLPGQTTRNYNFIRSATRIKERVLAGYIVPVVNIDPQQPKVRDRKTIKPTPTNTTIKNTPVKQEPLNTIPIPAHEQKQDQQSTDQPGTRTYTNEEISRMPK